MKPLINENKFFCPLCGNENILSDYLKDLFKDNSQTLWLANMITHYRHNHITSWNKCWGNRGSYYRQNWFGDYDDEKHQVNERAKRQIVRKAKDYLLFHSIGLENFNQLQSNDPDTIKLVNKLLMGERVIENVEHVIIK